MEVCEQTRGRQAAAGQINSCMTEAAVWRALEKEKEAQSVIGSILRFFFLERDRKKKGKKFKFLVNQVSGQATQQRLNKSLNGREVSRNSKYIITSRGGLFLGMS